MRRPPDSRSLTAVPADVTVVVTSCGRPDLLGETLHSFRRFHTLDRLVVSEDSGDPRMVDWLATHAPEALVLHGDVPKTGLMASIDRVYGAADTPYVFHIEDDWRFDAPVDFAGAVAALESDATLSQVCVRAWRELKRRHRAGAAHLRVGELDLAIMAADTHSHWYGYSSNPALTRRAFWQAYAPVARFRHDDLSEQAKRDGWRMAFALPGGASHTGDGRHVADPFEPRAQMTGLRAWRRALASRLRRRAGR